MTYRVVWLCQTTVAKPKADASTYPALGDECQLTLSTQGTQCVAPQTNTPQTQAQPGSGMELLADDDARSIVTCIGINTRLGGLARRISKASSKWGIEMNQQQGCFSLFANFVWVMVRLTFELCWTLLTLGIESIWIVISLAVASIGSLFVVLVILVFLFVL